MRITIKTINGELSRLGHEAQLAKGDGYFYFRLGETSAWLDTTVRVSTLSSLTLEQWVAEFDRLKKLNESLLGGSTQAASPGTKRPSTRRGKKK